MSAYDYSSRPSTAGGGGVYTPSNAAPRDDQHLEKIQAVQKQADEVADIARQNVNQALSNIEKLEVMEEKSAQLEMHAKDFHKNAVRLRRKVNLCIIRKRALTLSLAPVLPPKLQARLPSALDPGHHRCHHVLCD